MIYTIKGKLKNIKTLFITREYLNQFIFTYNIVRTVYFRCIKCRCLDVFWRFDHRDTIYYSRPKNGRSYDFKVIAFSGLLLSVKSGRRNKTRGRTPIIILIN